MTKQNGRRGRALQDEDLNSRDGEQTRETSRHAGGAGGHGGLGRTLRLRGHGVGRRRNDDGRGLVVGIIAMGLLALRDISLGLVTMGLLGDITLRLVSFRTMRLVAVG